MKNSIYVTSWNVQLLPNGIYELLFNTAERWIIYHKMNNGLYIFGDDIYDQNQEDYKNRMQEIPEFLPKTKGVVWMNSCTQEKDQIIYYFIPFKVSWLKEGKIKTILDSKS